MLKKTSYWFLILLFVRHITLAQDTQYIIGNGYAGYIFDSAHAVLKSIKDEQRRYTPTKAEINEAEMMLRKQIAAANSSKINQGNGCPVIHKKLRKYYRQYLGFIDKQGNKVIWINLFWNKDLIAGAGRDIVMMNDGCSYYWSAEVNLTTAQLSNLDINGNG